MATDCPVPGERRSEGAPVTAHAWTFCRLALAGVLALVFLFAACNDGPAEAPPVADQPSQQQSTADAPSQQQTADAPPDTDDEDTSTAARAAPSRSAEPSNSVQLALSIDQDTLWLELFDALSADEQACIRDALAEEDLDSLLATPIVTEEAPTSWSVSIFACLEQPTAEALFISTTIVEMEADQLVTVGLEEEACLRAWVTGIDVPAMVAAMEVDDSAAMAPVVDGFIQCMPDALLAAMIAGMGLDPDGLSEAQQTCLREWIVEFDWSGFLAGADDEDPVVVGELMQGLVQCIPRLFVSLMFEESGVSLDELNEEEESCLQEWAAEADWSGFWAAYAAGDLSGVEALAGGLVLCVPDLFQSLADEAPSPAEPIADVPDDHADALTDATLATVGEAIEGALDYEGDLDSFVLAFEAGRFYQVDVELGTLSDSTATLYGPDGEWLSFNDDRPESLASRIVWRARSSGSHYVQVAGLAGTDTGSYTLTVIVRDITDDHADSVEGATPSAIGDALAGELDYAGDLDVFAYEFEAGRLYQIDVTLSTLADSVATLYGSEGEWLASNDDHQSSPASRIYWEAESSGRYYVEVSSYGGVGVGGYTVMVSER